MPLHIVPLYAGICGILLLILSNHVIYYRLSRKVGIGDGDVPELRRQIRVQANFVEYVPFCLTLLAFLELNGSSPQLLHGLGGGLVLSRLLHAMGLSRYGGASVPRFTGTTGTFIVLFIASIQCIRAF